MVRENSSISFCCSVEDNVRECKCVAPLAAIQIHYHITYSTTHNTSNYYSHNHYINVFNTYHSTHIIKDIDININTTDIQELTTYTYSIYYYNTIDIQLLMNFDITILVNVIILLVVLIYIMRLTVDYIVSNL